MGKQMLLKFNQQNANYELKRLAAEVKVLANDALIQSLEGEREDLIKWPGGIGGESSLKKFGHVDGHRVNFQKSENFTIKSEVEFGGPVNQHTLNITH